MKSESSRPLTAPLLGAEVCTYYTMHDSDALRSFSLQYVCCAVGWDDVEKKDRKEGGRVRRTESKRCLHQHLAIKVTL